MKLDEHVGNIRELIESAFDKQFARLGIGKTKKVGIGSLPENLHNKRERFERMLDSHMAETGHYETGRGKLIDELTFTLFNRLAAVKVMEKANLFPPVLTKQAEHGDRSFGHKAWLEIRPDMRTEELEGIREFIKDAFDDLGKTLPLFNRSYPYALLPDAVSLNEIIDAFNSVERDSQVGSEIWQSDDVLGWMYESYNNNKKEVHKGSGAKTEYDKVSLQSQFYTPRWVVQFLIENSLGKLYLEMFPNSEIKHRHKIANAPTKVEREPKGLQDIRIIDPACGSGNFLLYAFDFLYELYLDQIDNFGAHFSKDQIPKLIIENNLYGIDLDDRAVQLAQLGLFIKAKKKQRSTGEFQFKVVCSDFFLPDYQDVKHIFEEGGKLDERQKELISDVWKDLQTAYKFGSLIRLDEKLKSRIKSLQSQLDEGKYPLFNTVFLEQEKSFAGVFFANLKTAIEQFARTGDNTFLSSKTRDAITFLEVLTTEYDVATANPPYTDGADFGPDLKAFIEANYKEPAAFHTNLYASFIKRCCELTAADGKVAMIHPRTFMFIKTFEDVRKYILETTHINVFVDYSLSNLFGSIMVDPAFYVLEKSIKQEREAWFVSLDQYTRTPNEKFKKDFCLRALDDAIAGSENEHNYFIPQSKLQIIKTWPFIYWISDEFREKFKGTSVKDVLKNCQGLATANNLRFLRFWWELSEKGKIYDDNSWVFYAKGGPYKKWSGNLWLMVNWKSNGAEIRNYTDDKGKQKSRPQNESVFFKEGVTYSASGSKGPSYRLLPEGCIFDVGGSCIFPIKKYKNTAYILAFFNSTFSKYVVECLNPTVNKQVGDIERLPFAIPSAHHESQIAELSRTNIEISSLLDKFNLCESGFTKSPLEVHASVDWRSAITEYINYENHLRTQILLNEAIINETIYEVYALTEADKSMVIAKDGQSIGGLGVLAEAKAAYLTESKSAEEHSIEKITEFIKFLPERQFSAEEQQAVESGFATLYQNNNDLEEFCIRHQINPINVWFWLKQRPVIPQGRMHTLAMEFLVDIVREILLEDEDGIIPLVPNAGEKVLLDRVEDKFRERGYSAAQYASFESILGRSIAEYLYKDLFAELSEHLNLFMYQPKTPFIWHLSSGIERGFDCYVIIYKWSRDKLMRLRSVYIEHRERALANRQSDLANNESADAQNEREHIFKQLKEIEIFKSKIDELLAEGYDPVLEDGVGKNIAPLQHKKLTAYEVLNAGQLKKYLNADW